MLKFFKRILSRRFRRAAPFHSSHELAWAGWISGKWDDFDSHKLFLMAGRCEVGSVARFAPRRFRWRVGRASGVCKTIRAAMIKVEQEVRRC